MERGGLLSETIRDSQQVLPLCSPTQLLGPTALFGCSHGELKQRLSLLCSAFVAAMAWRAMPGAWEVRDFSPWMLLFGCCLTCILFPGHQCTGDPFFSLPAGVPLFCPIPCHSVLEDWFILFTLTSRSALLTQVGAL